MLIIQKSAVATFLLGHSYTASTFKTVLECLQESYRLQKDPLIRDWIDRACQNHLKAKYTSADAKDSFMGQ